MNTYLSLVCYVGIRYKSELSASVAPDGRNCTWNNCCPGYHKHTNTQTRHHKHTLSTMKHGGGGVMVWGYFSATGPWGLVKGEGRVNAEEYLQILEDNLQEDYDLGEDLFSSKTATPNIQQELHRNGSKTKWMFWRGQVKAQNSSQSRLCGWTWKELFMPDPRPTR